MNLALCSLRWTVRSGPPTIFDWHFREAVRTADIGNVRFHDLRHSHATQLLRKVINVKAVSERLGHAYIRITLEAYAHGMSDMQEDAANVISDLIEGESRFRETKCSRTVCKTART